MTWRSFVGFWIMRELGQEDAVFRNYDLLAWCGKPENYCQSAHLWLALKRCGVMFTGEGSKRVPWAVAEVAQRLVNIGCERPTNDKLMLRLIGWYTWDRIRAGDLTMARRKR